MRDSDRKKFVRLANKRVNSTIKQIRLVSNLSNRSNYDYTAEDVDKIFTALQRELRAARKKFEPAVGQSADAEFVLE